MRANTWGCHLKVWTRKRIGKERTLYRTRVDMCSINCNWRNEVYLKSALLDDLHMFVCSGWSGKLCTLGTQTGKVWK